MYSTVPNKNLLIPVSIPQFNGSTVFARFVFATDKKAPLSFIQICKFIAKPHTAFPSSVHLATDKSLFLAAGSHT